MEQWRERLAVKGSKNWGRLDIGHIIVICVVLLLFFLFYVLFLCECVLYHFRRV